MNQYVSESKVFDQILDLDDGGHGAASESRSPAARRGGRRARTGARYGRRFCQGRDDRPIAVIEGAGGQFGGEAIGLAGGDHDTSGAVVRIQDPDSPVGRGALSGACGGRLGGRVVAQGGIGDLQHIPTSVHEDLHIRRHARKQLQVRIRHTDDRVVGDHVLHVDRRLAD